MDLNKSLYELVYETSLSSPNNDAIYFENHTIKYSELIKQIDEMADQFLKLGIKAKDIVTVCMPNMKEAVYALYALNKIGAICYEVHPKTTFTQMKKYMIKTSSKYLLVINIFAKNFKSILEDPSIKMITFNPYDYHNLIKAFVCHNQAIKEDNKQIFNYHRLSKIKSTNFIPYQWQPKETSILLNSGGTSGEPKIIELSNFAINSLASNGTKILGITEPKGVYMLEVLPLFHGFGLCMGVHSPLIFGACVTLMIKFHTKETIRLLYKGKITIMIGVPALYKVLLKKKKFHSSHLEKLTVAYVGGDFVSHELIKSFNEVMIKYHSKARLMEGYGLTETVTVCSVNTINDNVLGSVGKAVDHAKIKIVDLVTRETLKENEKGEIAVSGDIIMNGYYQNPTLNQETFLIDDLGQKWVLTGDFGYLSKDYLFFKQRLKRIVKVSGMIICPSDVENIAVSLDEVHESYASAVVDNQRDHMIVLYIVKDYQCKLSNETLNKKINDKIKEEISVYAVPQKIIYLTTMPKTEIGKIDGKYLDSLTKGENN